MSAASTKGMRPRHLQQNETSAKNTFSKLSHLLGLSGRKTFQRCKLWMGMRKEFLFGANKLRKCFEIRHFVCVWPLEPATLFRHGELSFHSAGNGPLRGNKRGGSVRKGKVKSDGCVDG